MPFGPRNGQVATSGGGVAPGVPAGTAGGSAFGVSGSTAAPTGAGTPNDLVLDAKSGLYYSPTTQNFYQKGADGTFTTMRDPNVASAVASFYGAGNAFTEKAQPYAEDYRNVFGQETGLANSLQNTISNPGAASVAHEQLNQALQANEAAQLSQAAGASGGNAFLARRGAANNIAGLDAKAGQDAALLRAQEVAAAQNNLGGLLGQQADQSKTMYGTNTGYGLDYNKLAAATKAADLGNQTSQRGQNIQIGEDVSTGLGSAGKTAATLSDPSLKHDIHDESPEAIHKFLEALNPSGFKYNTDDGEDPERHGIMTTDLKKSEIGRSLVRETPQGEGFDQGQALGAMFQALADMHRRTKALEGRGG